jgi:hypothetical protein
VHGSSEKLKLHTAEAGGIPNSFLVHGSGEKLKLHTAKAVGRSGEMKLHC